jgi:hypothetical protein
VLYDAAGPLAEYGFEIDAMVCRTMAQGIAVLQARGPHLPVLVVVALGTNGAVNEKQINQLLAIVGPKRSDVCVATASSTSSVFGPLIARRHAVVSSRATGGRLIALVALGSGACAALIAEAHHPTTVVAQASIQRRRATLEAVPRSLQALGMFRCQAHLLVLGARRQGRQSVGAVVAVTVRRGPKAAATAQPQRSSPASRRAVIDRRRQMRSRPPWSPCPGMVLATTESKAVLPLISGAIPAPSQSTTSQGRGVDPGDRFRRPQPLARHHAGELRRLRRARRPELQRRGVYRTA